MADKKTETKETKKVTKKSGKEVTSGRVYVTATFNNTLVTVTDAAGNTLMAGSSGSNGFKGARKSTPYAATATVENVGRKAWDQGMRQVEVYIKGPGAGRDAALRALKTIGFDISLIADVTPIAHNGPRPKKKRRV
ncbi:30S ribosomal protein S11 [Patescibacteria group bacterium]|nr:30S ribosomal protein S11 [Patescibacteria group bacterium]